MTSRCSSPWSAFGGTEFTCAGVDSSRLAECDPDAPLNARRRARRSGSMCIRAASADAQDSGMPRHRRDEELLEQLRVHKHREPPFAVDDDANMNGSFKVASFGGKVSRPTSGHRARSLSARGVPRGPRHDSRFLLNLDQTYQGPSKTLCGDPEERELRKVCELVGEKVQKRFQKPRDCFKCVNTGRDGCVTRSEVRAFFRAFNVPDETADRLFARLDTESSGLVAYRSFKGFVEEHMKVKERSESVSSTVSTRAPSPVHDVEPCDSVTDFASMSRPRSARLRRPQLTVAEMQRQLDRDMKIIREKAEGKYPSFRHLRQAFRWVDASNEGRVTRREARNFFRVFGVQETTADYMFTLLGAERSDEISYDAFFQVLGPVIGVGHQEPSHKQPIALPGNASLEHEVNEVIRVLAEKAGHKFKHPRDALRALDLSHDGRITRGELRVFFRSFCLPCEASDLVFSMLDPDDESDTCDYEAFMALVGPYVDPEHHTAHGTGIEWDDMAWPGTAV